MPAPGRGAGSAETRRRLQRAAAELIAEVGWGRVTTRAVAERAGLPHGTVSYHFRGKRELLIDAALGTFEEAIPLSAFARLESVDQLLDMIGAEVGDPHGLDPVLRGVSMEAMREAERDPTVRRRMAKLMREYREVMAELIRADQDGGRVASETDPRDIATLLGAVGDGLLLHAVVDPKLDVGAALDALRLLLKPDS